MAIKYIGNDVKHIKAQDEVKEIFEELRKDMGDVVEPISLHVNNPKLLEAIWLILREVVIVDGALDRMQKEAIGASVSESNRCGYCVDAHTIMLIGLDNAQISKAIERGEPEIIADAFTKNIVKWGLENRKFDSIIVKYPPFTLRMAPEAIGTAVFFHYLNRMVFAFLGPTILPLNIPIMKGAMKKLAGLKFSKTLNAKKEYKILPTIEETNTDMIMWAKTNDQVYRVFANFNVVINRLAIKYIPISVQKKMKALINQWGGKDEFINDQSLAEFLTCVHEDEKPLATVLYIQAFSPNKMNKKYMDLLRGYFTEKHDEAILVSMSWVSFEIALYIGTKIGMKFNE